jgi:hypothetical protein
MKKDHNVRYIKYRNLVCQNLSSSLIDSFLLYFNNYIRSDFITKSGTKEKQLAWEKGWKFNLNKIK